MSKKTLHSYAIKLCFVAAQHCILCVSLHFDCNLIQLSIGLFDFSIPHYLQLEINIVIVVSPISVIIFNF